MPEFKGVQLKRSTVASAVPSSSQLVEGELAINLADKKLFSKNSAGVFELPAVGTITSDKLAASALTDIMGLVYPVGSQYVNFSDGTNPATLLGVGTWVAMAGRVVIGLDPTDTAFDVAGETGGSKDTVVVAHTHALSGSTSTQPAVDIGIGYSSGGTPAAGITQGVQSVFDTGSAVYGAVTDVPAHSHTLTGNTSSTGVSGTNTNLPPYVVAYVWKRTA